MKKELLNELNQMKFLFGYKPGRVISEQEMPEAEIEMSDVEFDFPEIAEPEIAPDVKPDTDKEVKPRTPRRPDRENAPLVDPHPQGRDNDEVEFELELDEPETDFEMDFEERPMTRRPRRFSRD